MSKVSIIVPVYNTGDKLKKCLDSLVNQTIKDIEIIIINDGSTDNSEKIIKEYIANYKKQKQYDSKENENKTKNNSSEDNNSVEIEFYSKENEGIAKTRNYGIEKANSDYILFVDSDDYIDLKLVEKLLPYIEQDIDLIKFKLQRVNENGEILEKTDGPVFEKTTGQEGFNKLYSQDVLLDSPCVYLIKKELFKKNNFTFKRTYHEDFGLIPLIIMKADVVNSISYKGYNYYQRQGSTMNSMAYEKAKRKVSDMYYFYKVLELEADKMKCNTTVFKSFITNSMILKITELNNKDYHEYLKKLKKDKAFDNILADSFPRKIKKICLKISPKLFWKIMR